MAFVKCSHSSGDNRCFRRPGEHLPQYHSMWCMRICRLIRQHWTAWASFAEDGCGAISSAGTEGIWSWDCSVSEVVVMMLISSASCPRAARSPTKCVQGLFHWDNCGHSPPRRGRNAPCFNHELQHASRKRAEMRWSWKRKRVSNDNPLLEEKWMVYFITVI
jgi:hypothetical protein